MNVISNKSCYKAFGYLLFTFMLFPSLFGNNNTIRTFYNVNDTHGISLRAANSVCEDDNGFIWISSKTGILRLTEDDCRSYLLPSQTSDIITVNMVYGVSGLIAYTNNGQFFRYSNLFDRFDFIVDLRTILNTQRLVIFNVLIDQEGIIYISSSYGFFRYTKELELELISAINSEKSHLAWYNNNNLFFSRNDGIYLHNIQTDEIESFPLIDYAGNFSVSHLFYDNEEMLLWIGTHSGKLMYLDVEKKKFRNTELTNLPNQPILTIEANTDSTIMLGYDGQGLWEITRNGNKILNVYREDVDNPLSLRGNGVYDIFKDSNERIWVCTYSGGVSFFDQSLVDVTQIRHIINNQNSLINNDVNDIFEDSEGNVWFATNNGVSRWNMTTNKWDHYLNSQRGQAHSVLSVFGDSEGKIWAGTWSAGVFVMDGKTGRSLNHINQNIVAEAGDFIFDILEDSQGDLWTVGVMEYVTRYKQKEKEIIKYRYEPTYVIKELNSDEMLLGCTFGLVLLNRHTKSQEILLDGYIVNDFFVLGQDVWCTTSGGGLIKLNLINKTYRKYTIESGLLSNHLNSIYYANGFLWIGTESGLCTFNPKTEEVLTYTSIIQLANISFNPGSGYLLSNGNLIFGTNQGAIMFNPYTLEPRKAKGQIFIQDIIISGRTIRDSKVYDLTSPVDSLEKLSLSYSQSTITIELLPKGIATPESKISWKLEGLDNVWSIPSSIRLLTFANLPSGNYKLNIRLYNNSLTEVIDERVLEIRVNPPFWGTLWFYILVIVSALGIIYFSFRYHLGLIQKLHSEEKVAFFANTAHEIRTALTLISGPIKEIRKENSLSERGRYYITLATEQVENLLKIATQLLDFQKFDKRKGQLKLKEVNVVELIQQRMNMFESFAESNMVSLEFKSNVDSCITAIDEDIMARVIDNLLSNAIKYSHKEGKVNLSFHKGKKSWELSVKDHGIGISQKGQTQLFKEFYRSENAVNSEIVGSGIGLLMVRNYIENHNGKVTCTSQENQGSEFKIELPYLSVIEWLSQSNMNNDTDPETQLEDLHSEYPTEEIERISNINILVVEDNHNLREYMNVTLSAEFNVSTVVNGKEAWEFFKKELPDLVISDVMMPEMDGFELCRLMKSTYETSHIPVILLTGLTEKAEQLHGIGLGADAYLTKPFDMSLLIKCVGSIISNRKAIREKALKLIDRDPEDSIMKNEHNDLFVKNALEIVKSNISNPDFGKDTFAREMNVSSSLLYKKIKSLTDQSPSDFIKSVRLKEALELLKSRKHTITEVSEMCGFSSVGYFSTVFKKYYRKTPSEILEG
jgi:signal transduction histidine kinase/DNA-binding response OmpR family regulator/ligand-binding sensor domain-containing protein